MKKQSTAAVVTPKDVDKSTRNGSPLVVSPPPAPELTSLLTCHVGCDGGTQGTDRAAKATAARDMDAAAAAAAIHINGSKVADTNTADGVNPPPKRKQRNLKPQKKKLRKQLSKTAATRP